MVKQTAQSVKCKCGNDKEYNPSYGWLDCRACRDTQKIALSRPFEFIPDRIKEDREEHKKDTIPPFRNGVLSKEFVDLYGTSKIEVTPEEVASAQNVWGELEYYNND